MAALTVWPVQVTVGPVRVTIPATPACRWIAAILERDLLGIIPGLVADNTELLDTVAAGGATVAQCCRAAEHAIEAASGVPWWTAVRLAHLSTAVPWIAGELVLSGVDAGKVSLGGWCAAVYRVVTRDREPKELRKAERELVKPPRGVSAAARFDPQRAAAAYDHVHVPG